MIFGTETVVGDPAQARRDPPGPHRLPRARPSSGALALLGGTWLLIGAQAASTESARPARESAREAAPSLSAPVDMANRSTPSTNQSSATPTPPGERNPSPTPSASSAPSESTGPATGLDFPSFRLVADRNIFNADRSRRSSRSGPATERPKQPQINTISLVGFLGSSQGDRAFFDGSSGSYRKALKVGESTGDLKLKSVCVENAVVEIGGQPFTLRVGDQLRREEEGPWTVSSGRNDAGRPAGGDSSTAGAEPAPPSTGDADTDSALQRLLKRRQQEENK